MVRLERIVIQGFKSFKRKTSIPFPEGFSVITGPNGSGKSNIGDSISFVLGRSSSKALRASLERIADTARSLIDDVEALTSRKAVA